MRHLTIDVSNYDSRLHIGKQGENLTREITFDCAAWLDGLTGGALSIVHQRPSDPDAYPCGNYVTDDTSLTWSINETDVAFSGLGKCELRYTIGSRIAKTKTFYTEIVNALNPLDTPPEAWEPYIDRVIDAATQEMTNLVVNARAQTGEQTSAEVTKHREGDHEVMDFNFTVEQGEQGEPGKSIVSVSATIDANVGTPSVDVQTNETEQGLATVLNFHNMKGIPGTSFDTSYLPSDTATGNPATFPDGAKAVPVDELTAEIVAAQDLHGYDKPWAGGAGKNKIDDSLKYVAGSTAVYIGGTSNGYVVPLSAGTYTISVDFNDVQYAMFMREENDTENTTLWSTISGLTQKTFTVSGGMYRFWVYRAAASGGVDVNNIKFVQVESGSYATSYEPYSNICPIVGHTVANITHNGDTDTIPFGQTVYGGSLNVTTGVLTIDRANISSYNGETIAEPWISSMDEYVSGNTPTTGAQVVYPVTPTTVQLTPDEVRTVLGNNSISANTGSVSVRYRADIGLYIDKKLA